MSPDDTAPVHSLRHGAATDPGAVRAGNEDALLVDPELGLYVVADGLGGHRAGEVASQLAVERIHEWVRRRPPAHEAPDQVLARALLEAHDGVKKAAVNRPELAGMGTTAVIAWIPTPDRMWLANVGDSRAYRLRDRALERLTDDDTALEQLRRAGALPEDPAEWPPRQELTQALGPSSFVSPHLSDHEFRSGDRILLCSDGLTDMLSDPEIRYLLSSSSEPQLVCDALVDAANLHGGLDNITVALIEAMPAGSGEAS